MSHTNNSFRPVKFSTFFVLLATLAFNLTACGDTPAAGPPPTLAPSLRQETNKELFFVMSIPLNWVTKSEKENVSYIANDESSVLINISSASASRLTSDSSRILQEKLDSMKNLYPRFRQENAGVLHMIGGDLNLIKVTFTDNGAEFSQFLAEVNSPLSNRAYILSGRSPSTTAETRKQLFVNAFESFKPNAPLVVPATLTAAAGGGDPTALALSLGGKVSGSRSVAGKVTPLVDWNSPLLVYNTSRFIVNGLFPQDWQWRAKPFPSLDRNLKATSSPTASTELYPNPGFYLTSPNNDALIQLGLVPNVFKSNEPATLDEYKKAIDPYLASYNQYIVSLGSRNAISELSNVGTSFRETFIARNETGATNARGVIVFRGSGQHLVMGVVTLSPEASLKQNLIEGYDTDMQALMNSLQVISNN